MKKPCIRLEIWDKFIKCLEFWVKISVIFRQKPEFVILSVSEVSNNGKFSFNLCGFFAFLQRLKMTKRVQKPKNKEFKNFSVLKSASNERERSPPPKHCSIFALLALLASPANTILPHWIRCCVMRCQIHYTLPRHTARQISAPRIRRKHRHAQRRCVKMTQSISKSRKICFQRLVLFLNSLKLICRL